MNVLIAVATASEIEIVKQFLEGTSFRINQHQVDLLITGIGGIATTYSLTKSIQSKRPDHILQAGIAGSFHTALEIGTTVCVREEVIGDLGAEENSEFRDLFDLGLMRENDLPFNGRVLNNPFIMGNETYGLPLVRSVSNNEISTRKERIELLERKFNAEIESMEGAAFHYVCLSENIPFIQIRTISNYVGERNKAKWKIPMALENLNSSILKVLRQL